MVSNVNEPSGYIGRSRTDPIQYLDDTTSFSARNSKPSAKIESKKNSKSIAILQYPQRDFPKYHTTIYQMDPGNLDLSNLGEIGGLTDLLGKISDTADKIYSNIIEFFKNPRLSKGIKTKNIIKIPLPIRGLQDQFDVMYDQNFNYGMQRGTAAEIGGVVGRGLAASGLAINTFKSVTLSVPQFRRHNLTFKMAPKDFNEAKAIQKIAYLLRRAMTPKRAAGGLLFEFPDIFLIAFSPNSKFLYKFKPCVLERINVDYTGGNQAPGFYRQQGNPSNAPPESVVITLQFLELEYWLDDTGNRSDYKTDEEGLPQSDPLDVFNFYTTDINPDGTPDEI